MLVYELVPNGSLDKHLHDPQRLLAWTDRYRYSNSSSELRITQPFISDFHLEFVLTQVQDCARCGLGHTVPPHGVRAVRLARGVLTSEQSDQKPAPMISRLTFPPTSVYPILLWSRIKFCREYRHMTLRM